jgi:HK97 family phage major capsid protein
MVEAGRCTKVLQLAFFILTLRLLMSEEMILLGDTVKALGEGKVGGYLVRFGSPDDVDLEGEFFSKNTELGIADGSTLPIFYNHGTDKNIKNHRVGRGVVKFDEVGAWLESQLELRDDYERAIYQLAIDGKLGYSSGAIVHLIEREDSGKAVHIKSWPVGEASLTPHPAESRNKIIPIKSLFKEETIMDEKEIQALVDAAVKSAVTEATKGVAETASQEAVKAYAESVAKDVKAGNIEVVEDETDKAVKAGTAFKSNGEFFKAVMHASSGVVDKRLLAMKAQGLNEAVPSQGGFLVPQTVASGILQNMWNPGTFLSLFRPIPVSGNSLLINAIDETSRANGSRMGGVLGYWLEEAATKSLSKPKFRQISLKLKKVAAACYATDELLEDTTALESWLGTYVPEELRFMTGAAIMDGSGAGTPLGILQSGALVSVLRDASSAISANDILSMWARRYVGVNDYVWLANANVAPQVYTMTIGTQPVYTPPGGLSEAPYGRLLGRPYIETEFNPGLGTAGDLMLVSPSQYAMIDKGGVQSASSIHVSFLQDETCFRFVYRVDGQPAWEQPVTPFTTTDTISPFVCLSATTG